MEKNEKTFIFTKKQKFPVCFVFLTTPPPLPISPPSNLQKKQKNCKLLYVFFGFYIPCSELRKSSETVFNGYTKLVFICKCTYLTKKKKKKKKKKSYVAKSIS